MNNSDDIKHTNNLKNRSTCAYGCLLAQKLRKLKFQENPGRWAVDIQNTRKLAS